MVFDNDKTAKCLAFQLNKWDKSAFFTQIIDKQNKDRDSFKIAKIIFKIINKGER
jgi:hypothetical protein